MIRILMPYQFLCFYDSELSRCIAELLYLHESKF